MDKSNERIADFFRRLADLLEISGDNPFKTRSYRSAADLFDDMHESVARMARAGGVARLQEIQGVGKSIATQTVEFVATGTSLVFEELREVVPATVIELLGVRGIGIKTAQMLFKDFGILSVDDLVLFAEGGGLDAVPGLGERAAERIASAARSTRGRLPAIDLENAQRIARDLAERVGGVREEVIVVGELRRSRARVRSVDLLVITDDPSRATNRFAALEMGDLEVLTASRAERLLDSGIRVVLRAATQGERAAALVRTTGSERHVRELGELAKRRGLEFRGFALRDTTDGSPLSLDGEEDLYAALDLRFIPPENREGMGEIEE